VRQYRTIVGRNTRSLFGTQALIMALDYTYPILQAAQVGSAPTLSSLTAKPKDYFHPSNVNYVLFLRGFLYDNLNTQVYICQVQLLPFPTI
jgi:hypothetical protein